MLARWQHSAPQRHSKNMVGAGTAQEKIHIYIFHTYLEPKSDITVETAARLTLTNVNRNHSTTVHLFVSACVGARALVCVYALNKGLRLTVAPSAGSRLRGQLMCIISKFGEPWAME